METMTLREVAAALGCNSDACADAVITNITIDSREAGEGTLFFAIKGDRFDAHDFVSDVIA